MLCVTHNDFKHTSGLSGYDHQLPAVAMARTQTHDNGLLLYQGFIFSHCTIKSPPRSEAGVLRLRVQSPITINLVHYTAWLDLSYSASTCKKLGSVYQHEYTDKWHQLSFKCVLLQLLLELSYFILLSCFYFI